MCDVLRAFPEEEAREWVRNEGEAALWMVLQLEGDHLARRGSESSLLQANERVRGAVRVACDQIYDSYRKAWNEAYTKLGSNPLELVAWRQHKVVILGDLITANDRNLTSEELQLASVAYGLSNREFHVPNPVWSNNWSRPKSS